MFICPEVHCARPPSFFSVEYFAHVLRFLRQWVKHPHWSATCCQSLLLPVHDLQEDTGDLLTDEDLKDKVKMERGELAMTSIQTHTGGKGNEAFEMNEIERADTIYRDPGPKSQRMEGKGRNNQIHDVDLGIGSRFKNTNVQGSGSLVNKVTVDVHEIDVGVHEADDRGPHFDNLGFKKEEGEARKVDFDGNEIMELDEEVKVEMCDQETQTELSLLDEVDDQTLEQLGFAHDESL